MDADERSVVLRVWFRGMELLILALIICAEVEARTWQPSGLLFDFDFGPMGLGGLATLLAGACWIVRVISGVASREAKVELDFLTLGVLAFPIRLGLACLAR